MSFLHLLIKLKQPGGRKANLAGRPQALLQLHPLLLLLHDSIVVVIRHIANKQSLVGDWQEAALHSRNLRTVGGQSGQAEVVEQAKCGIGCCGQADSPRPWPACGGEADSERLDELSRWPSAG